MHVTVVPCLRDNYAYLTGAPGAREVLVIDPGEAAPVERALAATGLALAAILLTHHHHDHVGGVAELVARHPGIPVLAHHSDRGRLPVVPHGLNDGDAVEWAGLRFTVLHVPGHTMGAVAYHAPGVVFTGDTLFGAGCGRLFEGTAAELHASLGRLAELPPETRVYSGHEYTEKNLEFAAHVEPENVAIPARRARVGELRARHEPSVPSTIAEELMTNPFLRVRTPSVQAHVASTSGASPEPAVVFAALRTKRNTF